MQDRTHILNASSNVRKMLENIRHLLTRTAITSIENEINQNGVQLFRLGENHFRFASHITNRYWRQKVSRLYYAIFNIRRAVLLVRDGVYNTDLTDHKNVGELPDDFPNRETYTRRFSDIRQDRNLADYSHLAARSDLAVPLQETEQLAREFVNDARRYLRARGVGI